MKKLLLLACAALAAACTAHARSLHSARTGRSLQARTSAVVRAHGSFGEGACCSLAGLCPPHPPVPPPRWRRRWPLLVSPLHSPHIPPVIRGCHLLQGISPVCSNGYGNALTACDDPTQRTLGTLCCSAVTALGADCLASIHTSLSAPNGDPAAATNL